VLCLYCIKFTVLCLYCRKFTVLYVVQEVYCAKSVLQEVYCAMSVLQEVYYAVSVLLVLVLCPGSPAAELRDRLFKPRMGNCTESTKHNSLHSRSKEP
jgi:hypothetical protein